MGDFENQVPTQFIVVTQDSVDENELASRAAFFAENGDPFDIGAKGDKGDKGDTGDPGPTPTGADIVLTGLVAGTATPVADTDTVDEAVAKLQAQIDALSP